ncbi:MAG: hypothetical protein ACOC1Z_05870 [Cyanobacteriota bacterium]
MTEPTQSSQQNNTPESSSIEISERTNSLVNQNMANASESVREETKQLIEAITRKAQSETQKAGEFVQENYLEAVRNARIEIEKLNFDPERVEESIRLIQKDAEENWESLVKEVEEFGNRVNEAANAAWSILTGSDRNNGSNSSQSS